MKERPALTVKQWLASVPAERKDAINAVRDAVNEHLPPGYEETVDWGMLAWVVPLATLPNTHNGHPRHRRPLRRALPELAHEAETEERDEQEHEVDESKALTVRDYPFVESHPGRAEAHPTSSRLECPGRAGPSPTDPLGARVFRR